MRTFYEIMMVWLIANELIFLFFFIPRMRR